VADGRLYYRTEDGTVLLIEPSAKEYLERGRFEQPTAAGRRLGAPGHRQWQAICAHQDVLFCYDVKKHGM